MNENISFEKECGSVGPSGHHKSPLLSPYWTLIMYLFLFIIIFSPFILLLLIDSVFFFAFLFSTRFFFYILILFCFLFLFHLLFVDCYVYMTPWDLLVYCQKLQKIVLLVFDRYLFSSSSFFVLSFYHFLFFIIFFSFLFLPLSLSF